MKKVNMVFGLGVLLCLLCCLLTGCSHERDVGIIGGADGPTTIIVTQVK